jgi:hypothetical protein
MTGVRVRAEVNKVIGQKPAHFFHPGGDFGSGPVGIVDSAEAGENEEFFENVAGKGVGADETEVSPEGAGEGVEDMRAGRGQEEFDYPTGQLVPAEIPR